MSDGKMSVLFFEIGLVLTLISCVLGPCGIQDWSIACAGVAGFLALGGMYLAFGSWNEEEAAKSGRPADPHPPSSAGDGKTDAETNGTGVQ